MILPGILASAQPGHLSVAGNLVSLQTVTVGSGGASSITFSSIPQTYTHLQVRMSLQTTGALWLQTDFNGDTSTNYSSHALYANGSTVSAFGTATGSATYGYTELVSATAGSAVILDILDYTSTNKYKVGRSLWGNDRNGAGDIGLNSFAFYTNTNAVTSITFTAPFTQYSSFALYGVK